MRQRLFNLPDISANVISSHANSYTINMFSTNVLREILIKKARIKKDYIEDPPGIHSFLRLDVKVDVIIY